MTKRDHFLLRLNPGLLDALKQWANDELRSTNAQIEYLLADAVRKAGRAPNVKREPPPPDPPGRDKQPPGTPPGRAGKQPPAG